jgi:lauroyl/myristoyl acyltransferase
VGLVVGVALDALRLGARVDHDDLQALRRETLPKPVADYTDDLELTRDLLALHERLIRRFPEQYLWMYERWRYIPAATPPDERARYPFYAKVVE